MFYLRKRYYAWSGIKSFPFLWKRFGLNKESELSSSPAFEKNCAIWTIMNSKRNWCNNSTHHLELCTTSFGQRYCWSIVKNHSKNESNFFECCCFKARCENNWIYSLKAFYEVYCKLLPSILCICRNLIMVFTISRARAISDKWFWFSATILCLSQ